MPHPIHHPLPFRRSPCCPYEQMRTGRGQTHHPLNPSKSHFPQHRRTGRNLSLAPACHDAPGRSHSPTIRPRASSASNPTAGTLFSQPVLRPPECTPVSSLFESSTQNRGRLETGRGEGVRKRDRNIGKVCRVHYSTCRLGMKYHHAERELTSAGADPVHDTGAHTIPKASCVGLICSPCLSGAGSLSLSLSLHRMFVL